MDTYRIFGNRSRAYEKRKKLTRTIYDLNIMTEENWTFFRDTLDEITDVNQFNREFNSTNKDQCLVNRVWNIIESTIKRTMDITIKKKQ